MYCANCGNEIPENSKFCPSCGAPVDPGNEDMQEIANVPEAELAEEPDASGTELTGEYVTPNIVRCADGVYRWIYEFSMMRNPTIMITLFKIFGSIIFVGYLLLLIGDIRNWGFEMDSFVSLTKGALLFALFFAVLIFVSYMILAASYGWKYIVFFEMSDKEINHIQMQKQFDKAQALGWITVLVGMAANSLTAQGAGLMAMSRNASTSVLAHVTKVVAKRSRNVIYVNQGLFHNQVYVHDEDFDFVRDFIFSHVPDKAVKK